MNSTYRTAAPFRIIEISRYHYSYSSTIRRNLGVDETWWQDVNEVPHAHYRVFCFPYRIQWYRPAISIVEFGISRD